MKNDVSEQQRCCYGNCPRWAGKKVTYEDYLGVRRVLGYYCNKHINCVGTVLYKKEKEICKKEVEVIMV